MEQRPQDAAESGGDGGQAPASHHHDRDPQTEDQEFAEDAHRARVS
ncbi:MAG: hypothetical protein ACO4CT_07265 [Planctomycetota bacterium]